MKTESDMPLPKPVAQIFYLVTLMHRIAVMHFSCISEESAAEIRRNWSPEAVSGENIMCN